MRLLLDTHILLWVMLDDRQLTARARNLITDADSLHVSTVSLWELAIKRSLGKLKLDVDALDAHLTRNAIEPLAISWAHARQLRALPALHGDPFDRMLVAQALCEPLQLLTHDAALAAYSDLVILV